MFCTCLASLAWSTTMKNGLSSSIAANFSHVRPVREIWSSRSTFSSTIHCCNVVSSRNRKTSPDAFLINHRLASAFLNAGPFSVGAVAREDAPSDPTDDTDAAAGLVPGSVAGLRTTRNRWPQLVHLTVTPFSVTRSSSNSYSVPHFSHFTSIISPVCCSGPERSLINGAA